MITPSGNSLNLTYCKDRRQALSVASLPSRLSPVEISPLSALGSASIAGERLKARSSVGTSLALSKLVHRTGQHRKMSAPFLSKEGVYCQPCASRVRIEGAGMVRNSGTTAGVELREKVPRSQGILLTSSPLG